MNVSTIIFYKIEHESQVGSRFDFTIGAIHH